MAIFNAGSEPRTGQNFLSQWSEYLSFLPSIPGMSSIIQTPIALVLGFLGTAWDTVSQLIRGDVTSAVTALAAGTVSTTLSAGVGIAKDIPYFYWANLGAAGVTGRSAVSTARGMTEGLIGTATGVLGFQPRILQSHTVGMGSLAGYQASGPGAWATRVTPAGTDPNARYAAYASGGGRDHVAALEAARANGPAYRQV